MVRSDHARRHLLLSGALLSACSPGTELDTGDTAEVAQVVYSLAAIEDTVEGDEDVRGLGMTVAWSRAGATPEQGFAAASGPGLASDVYLFTVSALQPATMEPTVTVLSGTSDGALELVGAGDWSGDGSPDYAIGCPYCDDLSGLVAVHGAGSPGRVDMDQGLAVYASSVSGSLVGWDVAVSTGISSGSTSLLIVAGESSSQGMYLHQSITNGSHDALDADGIIRGDYERVVAGDWDGDGADELALSAWSAESNGVTYVFEEPSGTVTVEDAMSEYRGSGWHAEALVLETAADVDGDGIDDLTIGAPGDGHGGEQSGTVYVQRGATLGVQVLEESAWARIRGGEDYQALYSGVSAGGESGYLVVGGGSDSHAAVSAGAVYLFQRPLASGVYTTSQAIVAYQGAAMGDHAGVSMDGTSGDEPWLLVGAPGGGEQNQGIVYLLSL